MMQKNGEKNFYFLFPLSSSIVSLKLITLSLSLVQTHLNKTYKGSATKTHSFTETRKGTVSISLSLSLSLSLSNRHTENGHSLRSNALDFSHTHFDTLASFPILLSCCSSIVVDVDVVG